MTDDPTDKELACARKTRFNRLAHAEDEIDRQRREFRNRYRAYVCDVCSGWHLTKED